MKLSITLIIFNIFFISRHTTPIMVEWIRLTSFIIPKNPKKDLLTRLFFLSSTTTSGLIFPFLQTGQQSGSLCIYRKLCYSIFVSLKVRNTDEYIFPNKYKTNNISTQYVNTKLKEIVGKFKINSKYISTQRLRKSFGRRIWEMNNYSNRSLIILSYIFNHSNIAVTRKYLVIRQTEIFDVYENLN